MIRGCLCDDDDLDGCMYLTFGYPYCRPCEEHHRAPECPVDEYGRPDSWWTRQERVTAKMALNGLVDPEHE